MASVLIVERHAIFGAGIEAVLAQNKFRVLNRCDTFEWAVESAEKLVPELIILANDMCGRPHLAAAVQALTRSNDRARVILLTYTASLDFLNEALGAGIRGLVLKTSAADALVTCAEEVLQGRRWLDPVLLESLSGRATQANIASALTGRELDIALQVSRGLRNKQIAEALCVSEATVKMHLHHIYDKLRLSGRTALALAACSLQNIAMESTSASEGFLNVSWARNHYEPMNDE